MIEEHNKFRSPILDSCTLLISPLTPVFFFLICSKVVFIHCGQEGGESKSNIVEK